MAAGAVLAAAALAGPALRVGRHVPLGYNEGWNAYLAVRAVTPAAGPLYPPPGSLVFNNYPPLGFLVVGALARVLGADVIVTGRVVALAALLAAAGLLAVAVRRLGGGGLGAAGAGLLVLLEAAIAFPRYVAVCEPQWLGHALELAGLVVLAGGGGFARFVPGRLVAAALLMTAAGMVKQLLVALPLSVVLLLLLRGERRTLAIFLATAALGVAAAVAATTLACGSDALADVGGHRRVFSLARVFAAVPRLLLTIGPALALAPFLPRGPARLFALFFLLVATVTGLAERAGEGVNYNAHFEAMLASALVVGLAAARFPLAPAAAALPLLALLPTAVLHPGTPAAWRPVIARLAAAPAPVGCETLSLCFWAGKPWAVDLFNLEQAARRGGSLAPFAVLAARHGFGAIELDRAAGGADPLAHLLREAGYHAGLRGPNGSVVLLPPPPP